jgi:ADP-heptose:LPS heptosyltransferase
LEEPESERESARLLKRLRGLGILDLADRAAWDLGLKTEEKMAAVALLKDHMIGGNFAAIGVGTKAVAKDWGDNNWESLLRDLTGAIGDLALVAIGAGSDHSRAQRLLTSWRGPSANLCGECEPRVSAAVLERAALFVGHDSGPMHLAAAVGAPVVAIFSWHNPPGLWFPGHPSWKNIRVLYPDLGGNKWNLDLRFRRGPGAGILLIKPKEVLDACLEVMVAQS